MVVYVCMYVEMVVYMCACMWKWWCICVCMYVEKVYVAFCNYLTQTSNSNENTSIMQT